MKALQRKRIFIPILLFLVIIANGCREQPKATIRFCSYIDLDTPCEGEFDQYPKGARVWILFQLSQPSEGETLTGQLHLLDNGEKTFVSEKEFIMNPGEEVIMDLMIFGNRGKFLVEFVDSEGSSLAAKEIEIL